MEGSTKNQNKNDISKNEISGGITSKMMRSSDLHRI